MGDRSWILILVIALLLVGCGAENGDGDGDNNGNGGDPLAEARVRGDCPGGLAIGFPSAIEMRVTNASDEDWPVLYVTFFDGLDAFTVEGVAMDGAIGEKADIGIDTYAFNGGLDAGERGRVRVAVVPKDAGNIDLRFGAWGGDPDERLVNDDIKLVSCDDVAIRP